MDLIICIHGAAHNHPPYLRSHDVINYVHGNVIAVAIDFASLRLILGNTTPESMPGLRGPKRCTLG